MKGLIFFGGKIQEQYKSSQTDPKDEDHGE
jgi:hypothetical protein